MVNFNNKKETKKLKRRNDVIFSDLNYWLEKKSVLENSKEGFHFFVMSCLGLVSMFLMICAVWYSF